MHMIHPTWTAIPGRVLGLWLVLCPAAWGEGASWHLDRNYVSLHPDNRYFDTVEVVNDSAELLYIKTSVTRLDLGVGGRVTSSEGPEAIIVSPEEFVVRPGASLPVRVLADPRAQTVDSQSYYLRLTDVSKIREGELQGGMVSGFAIAYEALTVVKKTPYENLTPASFSVTPRPQGGGQSLHNLSGQHVFLAGGYECDTDRQRLVDCEQILDFPKQSLLPSESIDFSARLGRRYLGLLVNADLGFKTPVKAIHIPLVEPSSPAVTQVLPQPSQTPVR